MVPSCTFCFAKITEQIVKWMIRGWMELSNVVNHRRCHGLPASSLALMSADPPNHPLDIAADQRAQVESAFHHPTPIRIFIPGFLRLANSLMVRDKVHDNHRSAHQEGCRETMMHFALKFLVDDPLFEEEHHSL